jgi:ParB family chromosome partitioning protein
MSRKALGKGLGALIPGIDEIKNEIKEIPIDSIIPNPSQPRKKFDDGSLQELADSIKEHGVIEPIVVRPIKRGYELVVGERRLKASRKAGLVSIPAIISEMTQQKATEIALVENIQREDLNPIEEAEAYTKLMTEFGLTQEEVAIRVGKERSTIANRVRLLILEDEIKSMVEQEIISAGHAKVLLGIPESEIRLNIAKQIVENGLSVRQTEELINKQQDLANRIKKKRKTREDKDLHWADIEEQFRRVLGTRVNVKHKGNKGRIEIEFYSEEDIERILQIIIGT